MTWLARPHSLLTRYWGMSKSTQKSSSITRIRRLARCTSTLNSWASKLRMWVINCWRILAFKSSNLWWVWLQSWARHTCHSKCLNKTLWCQSQWVVTSSQWWCPWGFMHSTWDSLCQWGNQCSQCRLIRWRCKVLMPSINNYRECPLITCSSSLKWWHSPWVSQCQWDNLWRWLSQCRCNPCNLNQQCMDSSSHSRATTINTNNETNNPNLIS